MIRRRPTRHSGFGNLSRKHADRPKTDGHTFASGPEYNEYCKLKALQVGGVIKDLEVHPMFRFVINGINCGRYHADFAYTETATGKRVVVDVKGWAINKKTGNREPIVDSDYKLRTNLVRALFNLEVLTI